MNNNLIQLVNQFGFKTPDCLKSYLKSRARLNEYGAVCYTEKRNGFELTYSDNCKHQYMIGGNNRGIFTQFYL